MFLYIKTNILRGYGIFKNDFAHPREPASSVVAILASKLKSVSEMQDEFSVYERINEICPIKRNQM